MPYVISAPMAYYPSGDLGLAPSEATLTLRVPACQAGLSFRVLEATRLRSLDATRHRLAHPAPGL